MRTFCLILILVAASWVNAQNINRFMVVGDAHNYSPSPDFNKTVIYEITLAAIDEQVDFIFFTGDMIVRGFGSPAEEDSVLKNWRIVLDTLYHNNIKAFACRGNNDVSSREAWDSLFSGKYLLPQNGPANEKNITYTIEYDNILFISLDQYTESHKINQVWLEDLLSTKSREHIFAAGHEPAFKLYPLGCLNACPEERNLFWESLINAGTKVYFCGHNHFYDHTIIDDGDGNSYNDVHQVIVGTGGGPIFNDSEYDGDNGRWTPVRLFHEEEYGYVLVEINNSEVEMIWKHRVEANVFEYGGDSCTFLSAGTSSEKIILHKLNFQNIPNPFNIKTAISYNLSFTDKVELTVYDITGCKIATLLNKRQAPGSYKVQWDAFDVEPGVYFCQIKTGQTTNFMKMILIK
jgi:predicted MPP superfamily phosphohydrolase